MSIAALTLSTLLFIAGGSAMDEQVAPPPFGEPSFQGGFSLPIIHRNSPTSPLRDPTVTAFDLFKKEIQLASLPVLADASASEKMVVPTHFRRGMYLVPLRIGGSLDRISSSKLSFLAQVRVDKFSYCVPTPARRDDEDLALSYLRFGSQARISGKKTPFQNDKNHYHVYLNRVTYQHGNRLSQQQPVPIFPADGAEGSNLEMSVDSGTIGMWLPESIFYPLQKKIDADISLKRVIFFDNPNAYCYIGTMKDVEEVLVTLGFAGGAEMELFGDSLFFEFNNSEWICLGFTPSNTTLLGIYPQRNTNMGFDILKGEISIDQSGCSF
nr:unnamed protein product [Digitaria exilis]